VEIVNAYAIAIVNVDAIAIVTADAIATATASATDTAGYTTKGRVQHRERPFLFELDLFIILNNEMTKIVFKICSIKQEEKIIKDTKKSLAFLRKSRIIFTLPKKSIIKKEYYKEEYQNFKNKLEKEWQAREDNFFEKLEYFFNKKSKKQFKVNITNYGPLGFYNYLTGNIFINKNSKLDIINTIKHEVIHILIEPYIKKYQISHDKKEKAVNAMIEILK
jgi:hypothetical protein